MDFLVIDQQLDEVWWWSLDASFDADLGMEVRVINVHHDCSCNEADGGEKEQNIVNEDTVEDVYPYVRAARRKDNCDSKKNSNGSLLFIQHKGLSWQRLCKA